LNYESVFIFFYVDSEIIYQQTKGGKTMNRNSFAIALVLTIITTFIVFGGGYCWAQKNTTIMISVTDDAAAELAKWPKELVAFTSARTPIKSLNDIKSSANYAVWGGELTSRLIEFLKASGIQASGCMAIGNGHFPELFLKRDSLKLFVTSTQIQYVDKITESGGGIKVVFVDKNGKAIEQKGK
jgi:hypothetical protein